MGTTVQKLNKLIETKANIRTAIINKGVAVPLNAKFASYPSYITQISGFTPYGNIEIQQSAGTDVTEYATASVKLGTEGTPIATKGAVLNHQISITPSVSNTEGWIEGNNIEGSPITVTASELVSGTLPLTAGTSVFTSDATNYASVSVYPTPTESQTVTINDTIVVPSEGKYLSQVTVSIPHFVSAYEYFGSNITSFSSNAGGVCNMAFTECTSLTGINFPQATCIGDAAFRGCSKLEDAIMPMVEYVGAYAFGSCYSLSSLLSLSYCTGVGSNAFNGCSRFISVIMPECRIISLYAFRSCRSLSMVSITNCRYIASSAFYKCYNLDKLYLGSVIPTLQASNAFSSTPIGGYSSSAGHYGSIYVPSSMLSSYKTATNWTRYSSRFVGY